MLLYTLTLPITDDDLLSALLLLWLWYETVLVPRIRSCIVMLQKKMLKKQSKPKKGGKHKKEGKPKKTTVLPKVIHPDDSSYAPTCESTDHSGQEGTLSGVLKLSEDEETRWSGKLVNFGTVTNVEQTTKPPQFITIEKSNKSSLLQSAHVSVSSGSSASSSTSSVISGRSEGDAPDQLSGSFARIQTKNSSPKKSSLKSKTPAVAQATSFRLEDRQRYVDWKPRSFPSVTGLQHKRVSNFGREKVPYKNLKNAL